MSTSPPLPPKALPHYAAIDLGSNNCRLLIATPQNHQHIGQIQIVGSYSKSVRLGEGIDKHHRLSPAAMTRARDALQICKQKINLHQADKICAVATAACRRAENAQGFLDLILNQYGLDIKIIDAETEAKLAWLGCSSLVLPNIKNLLIFDIGGASTQVIFATKHDDGWQWQDWISLDSGVITLYDRIGNRALSQDEIETITLELQEPLKKFSQKNAIATKISEGNGLQIIGTSGTVTTLCGTLMGLDHYSRDKVDGAWLNKAACFSLMQDLLSLECDQRESYPCIGKDRSKLVGAGCLILRAIWDCWPVDDIRVADRGLREGILHQMMRQDGFI